MQSQGEELGREERAPARWIAPERSSDTPGLLRPSAGGTSVCKMSNVL